MTEVPEQYVAIMEKLGTRRRRLLMQHESPESPPELIPRAALWIQTAVSDRYHRNGIMNSIFDGMTRAGISPSAFRARWSCLKQGNHHPFTSITHRSAAYCLSARNRYEGMIMGNVQGEDVVVNVCKKKHDEYAPPVRRCLWFTTRPFARADAGIYKRR